MREGARERITANHINITYIVEYVAVVVLFVFRSYKLNRFSLLLLLPLLYLLLLLYILNFNFGLEREPKFF